MAQVYNHNGQDVTATQWNLLKHLTNRRLREKSNTLTINDNKVLLRTYGGDESLFAHDILTLAKMGFIEKTTAVTGKKLSSIMVTNEGMGDADKPSKTPLHPGVRRPIVSNANDREQTLPATITDALSNTAKVGLQSNLFMMKKIAGIRNWHPDFNADARAAIKELQAWGTDPIFSDTYCDWRGRVYNQSSTFGSYLQGGTMRALLEATEADEVDVDSKEYAYFLTIIKAEYNVTEGNYKSILNLSDKAIAGPKTLQRIRAAWAIAEIKRTGSTRYMVEQDASCSGGQFVALMTGDQRLGKYTNLLPDVVKHDLYMLISEDPEARELLSDKCVTDPKQIRNAAKPAVMQGFYGASATSISEKIWDDHDGAYTSYMTQEQVDWDHPEASPEEKAEWLALSPCVDSTITWLGVEWKYEEIENLTTMMHGRLFKEFPKFADFKKGMNAWYRDCAKAAGEAMFVEMEWVTPNGMLIQRTIKDGSTGGAMPNFVHSVDASVVHLVINQCAAEGITLKTVHDAFFTTISNTLRLRQIVADAYRTSIEAVAAPAGVSEFTPNASMLRDLNESTLVGEVAYA